ncbi:MAG TPA: hypothetical protein VHX44_13900 [Planctomycetota bacterium]|jgi:hypothetical protein|nr:hypothetical protein [Planctomycetota bacterium]
MGLTPGLIEATDKALGDQVVLPTPALALRLSGDYRAPVWCSDHGRLAPVGGPAVNALLILVPLEAPAAP